MSSTKWFRKLPSQRWGQIFVSGNQQKIRNENHQTIQAQSPP